MPSVFTAYGLSIDETYFILAPLATLVAVSNQISTVLHTQLSLITNICDLKGDCHRYHFPAPFSSAGESDANMEGIISSDPDRGK